MEELYTKNRNENEIYCGAPIELEVQNIEDRLFENELKEVLGQEFCD